MASTRKIALITGGANGMGLGIATELSQQGIWDIHIVDLNEKAGKAVVDSLINTTFHQCDVSSYKALGNVFKNIFKTSHRLDFVFANAGIHEITSSLDFWSKQDTGLEPPPEPLSKLKVVDICLYSVMNTCYLAQHYFRLNTAQVDCNLVITASCGSLYLGNTAPFYTAAKHGVLGFMRSIAEKMYLDNIRVNAICPGAVITNLLPAEAWSVFPKHLVVPMSRVVEVVFMFLDGNIASGVNEEERRIDGPKKKNDGEPLWGEAVELTPASWYFREQAKFADEFMKETMEAANGLNGSS